MGFLVQANRIDAVTRGGGAGQRGAPARGHRQGDAAAARQGLGGRRGGGGACRRGRAARRRATIGRRRITIMPPRLVDSGLHGTRTPPRDAGKRARDAISGRRGSATRPRDAATPPRFVDSPSHDARAIAKARIMRPRVSSFGYRDRETIRLARITRPRINETCYRITMSSAQMTMLQALITISGPRGRDSRRRDGGRGAKPALGRGPLRPARG